MVGRLLANDTEQPVQASVTAVTVVYPPFMI